jgi:hypothetical protein
MIIERCVAENCRHLLKYSLLIQNLLEQADNTIKKKKLSRYAMQTSSYSFLTSAVDGVSGQRHEPVFPRE